MISVPENSVEYVKEKLSENKEFGGLFFDVKSMNGSIADTLSNDLKNSRAQIRNQKRPDCKSN